MKGKYKQFSEWCRKCDRYLLENGTKCPLCGYKSEIKSSKPNMIDLNKKLDKEYYDESKYKPDE